jgi:hypothetical protein
MACNTCGSNKTLQNLTTKIVNVLDWSISGTIQRIRNSFAFQKDKYKAIIDAFEEFLSENEFTAEQKELIDYRLAICLNCPSHIALNNDELMILQQFIRFGLFSQKKTEAFGEGLRKKCNLCGCPCTKFLVPKESDVSLRCPVGKW